MTKQDVSSEKWREYVFGDRTYRIDKPVSVWVGTTCHRVWDGRIVHCVPAPGVNGCVLRWEPSDPSQPVQF